MTAQIIDGKKYADLIREEVKDQVQLRLKYGKPAPGLATVLVGEDPASQVYVRSKHRAANKQVSDLLDVCCLPMCRRKNSNRSSRH